MAFNWQTFKTRALTAIVFVAVMLFGLLWNRWSFFLLFSIVHFGAWTEYQKLVSRFNPEYHRISWMHRYGIMIAGWCLLLFFTNYSLNFSTLALTNIGFWAGITFMVVLPLIMFIDSKIVFLGNIIYSIAGIVYISLPIGLLIELRTHWSEDAGSLSLHCSLADYFCTLDQ